MTTGVADLADARLWSTRLKDRVRPFATGAAVALAYVIAAQLGFRFAFVAEQVTTVWAPTGIGIAALVLWGTRAWPAIWIGAFIANVGSHAPAWTAVAVATGNTLEAVVAAAALDGIARFDPRLERVRDVIAFVAIGATCSTAVSATIGVTTLCAAGVQPWERFAALWRDWWLGDAVGALVVCPVILTWARGAAWTTRARVEAWMLLGGAVAAVHFVFTRVFVGSAATHPSEYVIFPFVVAAAARGGPALTSLVVLATCGVAIANTAMGAGPFAGGSLHDGLRQLQMFIGILAGTGLLLAAAIAERMTGERRRATAYAVGEVLARATDLRSAAPALLGEIGRILEWHVTTLWLLEPDGDRLLCAEVWSTPGMDASSFESASRHLALTAGAGLPGRVLATGEPAWMQDVTRDTNFRRREAARAAGVRCGFAFPVGLGERVLGVVECFNRSVVPPDDDLLRTMSTVGTQVGQFIARTRQEAAVADEQRRTTVARREAEAANRAKDEFLATLSHELRTPLNAILGWTRMLLDGSVDPRHTRRALEIIDRNARLQAALVEDILDVSRIITGGLRLDRRAVDLAAVVAAALDAVRPAADAKQVQLHADITGRAGVVQGDPRRLQQIVWNLLANAVKFTRTGGTVRIELADAGPGAVQVRVRDDGAGIDPEFLPHVFERFRQADGSIHREHGGLGLGLAIVRHLVELHGGTVVAESAGKGLGATFTVELLRGRTGDPDPASGPAAR